MACRQRPHDKNCQFRKSKMEDGRHFENRSMSMSMSIVDLYSAESRSISTALCVLSGNDEIGSFSTIV